MGRGRDTRTRRVYVHTRCCMTAGCWLAVRFALRERRALAFDITARELTIPPCLLRSGLAPCSTPSQVHGGGITSEEFEGRRVCKWAPAPGACK